MGGLWDLYRLLLPTALSKVVDFTVFPAIITAFLALCQELSVLYWFSKDSIYGVSPSIIPSQGLYHLVDIILYKRVDWRQ